MDKLLGLAALILLLIDARHLFIDNFLDFCALLVLVTAHFLLNFTLELHV